MDSPTLDQVTGLLRVVLGMLGTALVSHGIGNDALWSMISGSVIAVLPLVWAYVANSHASKATAVSRIQGVQVVVDETAPNEIKALARSDSAPDVVMR